jgi:membrane fusion protein (multidrug efflux system)
MKKQTAVIALLAIIAIIAAGIAFRYFQNKKTASASTAASQVSVTAETIAWAPMKEVLSYTGVLAGNNQVTVVSQTSGTVEKVRMEVGRRCRQGDTLAVADNEMQQAGLAQAQAQVLAAQTNHEKALKDLKRTQALAADSAISQSNLENAQLGADAALAQLKSAQAALSVARKHYDDTYIRTPISGSIAAKKIDRGATVAPGTEIAVVVDDSRFKVTAMVSEMDINKMQTGDTAAVTVDAVPGTQLTGRISAIGSVPSQQGRLYPVEISVEGQQAGLLKAGMFCRAAVTAKTIDSALSVPEGAVATDPDGNQYIFTVENDRALRKTVKLGFKYAGRYQVLSGLERGSTVIVSGRERVSEGAAIVVVGRAVDNN